MGGARGEGTDMVGRLLIYPTYFIRFTFYTKPKEGRLKLGGLRTCCPLATPARKRAAAHMAPLDGAEKAAVLDLFAGRRGTRTLIESTHPWQTRPHLRLVLRPSRGPLCFVCVCWWCFGAGATAVPPCAHRSVGAMARVLVQWPMRLGFAVTCRWLSPVDRPDFACWF